MKRGKFIVLEGLDGAGTSTQAHRLHDYLVRKGIPVESTREPTDGPIGAMIRLAIKGHVEIDMRTLALAFAADRTDHLFNSINGVQAMLESGTWVVSDRYVLSSLAYQSASLGELDWVREINRFAIAPDLTIFLRTPAETCIERIARRSSHEELFHDESRLIGVEKAFLEVIDEERYTGKLLLADGRKAPDAIFETIAAEIDRLCTDWAQP